MNRINVICLGVLAQDINETNPPEIGNGFGGVTLAYNVKSEQEVHEIIELARKTGARVKFRHPHLCPMLSVKT